MTFLHHSTLALRRMVAKGKLRGSRTYTQFSSPVYKMSQAETAVSGRQKLSDGLAIPVAFVILGLSFSTFSTHQIMTCRNSSINTESSIKDA